MRPAEDRWNAPIKPFSECIPRPTAARKEASIFPIHIGQTTRSRKCFWGSEFRQIIFLVENSANFQ